MNPALPANERGKWWSMVLAALVHAALGLFLFFGVRWQNRLPDPIEVELVSAPPPAAQLAPPPAPAPAPPVTARPKPPAPEPEDEPEPEPPPRKQPDIAIKAPEPQKKPPKPVKEIVKPVEKPVVKAPKPEPKPEPKPKPKPEHKPEPKPEPKAKPEPVKTEKPSKPVEKPVKTDKAAKAEAEHSRALEDKRMRELMARDSESASQSHQLQEELARVAGAKASAARNKAIEAYVEKIRAKVKGNIVLPPGVSNDPFAIFYVDQLPDGSVIEVRLKRSTGNAQLDAAIERAIQKSSPLPKPDKPELFNRTLELKFYPLRD
ncbi:TonB C-terminal domain-containing protein [Zoogloea sp.]|uniref:energy transducer TonB n=1 Tax=Zoogloea sp. TaxID=49181 RepID=UPI00258E4C42|nr:TonB C-terminal domain-containing protein [Zoogloea sp.]MDD2667478.1 TonB C-terminal domain-containing protein [Zoogloea sp.]